MVTYRDDFPQRLIAHMGEGQPMTAFAAELGCSRRTLSRWVKAHKEFRRAKAIGECALEAHMVRLGKRIASGSLVRISREEPVLDSRGQPVFDSQGKAVSKRYFVPVQGNPVAWIFLMKNMCGWRNDPRVSVNVSQTQQQGVTVRSEVANLTDEELAEQSRIAQMTLKLAQEKIPDGPDSTVSAAKPGKKIPAKRRASRKKGKN